MPTPPKPETNEVQPAQAVDPAAICSRFAADDARLVHLRGASTKQLITILAESVSDDIAIPPIYFALGMDSRFRATQPEDLRELIAVVILERRGANNDSQTKVQLSHHENENSGGL